ncbi:MAG: hypothetical protein ACRC0F_05700 [Cetobacterium sp.]
MIDLIENELSEKLVNTILKARKNRFVDLAYSQKAMDKIIAKYDEKDIIKGLNELCELPHPNRGWGFVGSILAT